MIEELFFNHLSDKELLEELQRLKELDLSGDFQSQEIDRATYELELRGISEVLE